MLNSFSITKWNWARKPCKNMPIFFAWFLWKGMKVIGVSVGKCRELYVLLGMFLFLLKNSDIGKFFQCVWVDLFFKLPGFIFMFFYFFILCWPILSSWFFMEEIHIFIVRCILYLSPCLNPAVVYKQNLHTMHNIPNLSTKLSFWARMFVSWYKSSVLW